MRKNKVILSLILFLLIFKKLDLYKYENPKRVLIYTTSYNGVKALDFLYDFLDYYNVKYAKIDNKLNLLEKLYLFRTLETSLVFEELKKFDFSDQTPLVVFQIIAGLVYQAHWESQLDRNQKHGVVIVTNDHSPDSVALRYVARELGFRVFYRQHAPVTKYFEDLDFDHYFLFDEDSKLIYQNINQLISENRVSIYKTPFKIKETVGNCNFVGIFLSTGFNYKEVNSLLLNLKVEDTQILIFPHPSSRVAQKKLKRCVSIVSNDRRDTYVSQVKCAIVGNSGVTSELMQRGILTYHNPRLDNSPFNYYGYDYNEIFKQFDGHESLSMMHNLLVRSEEAVPRRVRTQETNNTALIEILRRLLVDHLN